MSLSGHHLPSAPRPPAPSGASLSKTPPAISKDWTFIFNSSNIAFVIEQSVVGGFEPIKVALELLCLPPCPAVLEPYRHLPGLQAQLLRQIALPLRLQLVLRFKASFKQLYLFNYESPEPLTICFAFGR
ncbi:hypothetical protein IEQ34_009214 [Dendrobium chrysotoxum]|uniref:Uncharacterized protein n=1 Tax=Dendrobium chrysotoxum TaxID=161865 RepID=A0AAV7GIM6_DENCH|nr:hypothetical protein IEQ34_009214 [Dendrobium chrysotoxum]